MEHPDLAPRLPAACRIELLGGLRLVQGDRVQTRFRTQRAAALLAFLAYHRGRVCSREELAELLWPESEADSGRTNLRAEVAALRRQLEPPGTPAGTVLLAGRHQLSLRPEAFSTDVAELETALAAAAAEHERRRHLLRAVELYQGDLLPGHYEEWVGPERERLRARFVQALLELANDLAADGAGDAALGYARRAVAADPLDEQAHREVIRLAAGLGQPVAALRQYADLERLLWEHLEAEPSPATRELIRRVRAGEAPDVENGNLQYLQSRAVVEQTAPQPSPRASGADSEASRGSRSPHLPRLFTRFFGRERELARLRELLSPSRDSRSPRVVTLCGVAGSGKTRLAMEAAWEVAGAWGGAVRFVPLADLRDVQLVPSALCQALQLVQRPGSDPVEHVAAALADSPFLLVLDNCEHLLPEAAELVERLLHLAPSLVCLATSRQRLGLDAEWELPLPPLPIPELTQTSSVTPEQLVRFGGVQLFVDRAQWSRPDFQVTARNAAAVAAVCARLEGIPLALELAAAWASVLTPAQMLAQMEDRFTLLVARRSGAPPRHQTLLDAVAWSYDRLPPELRRFFARLSVFRGGWTLEAARDVCEEPNTQELLAQLQDRSLVVGQETGSEMRFRMLETLRVFAAAQLAPEELAHLSRRHTTFYLGLAEAGERALTGPGQVQWLERQETEHDNFRSALDAASDEERLRLTGSLYRFWAVRGPIGEGRQRLAEALAADGQAGTAARAKALLAACVLAHVSGDLSMAETFGQESLAICEALNDRAGAAAAMDNLGLVAAGRGDLDTAGQRHEQSLSIRREIGDHFGIATSLNNLGILAHARGDYPEAGRLHEESLALRREIGDLRGIAGSLHNLGQIEHGRGDFAAARIFYLEALALNRRLGNLLWASFNLNNLGNLSYLQGDYAAALRFHEESLEIRRTLRIGVADALANLGNVAMAQGDYNSAYEGYAESIKSDVKAVNRVGIACCLEMFARLAEAASEGRVEALHRAVRLYAAGAALRERLGVPLSPFEQREWEARLDGLRAALGPETFQCEWSAGQALDAEEAARYALDDPLLRPPGKSMERWASGRNGAE